MTPQPQCRCEIPTLESARARRDQLAWVHDGCEVHGRRARPRLWLGVGPVHDQQPFTMAIWYGLERLTDKEQ